MSQYRWPKGRPQGNLPFLKLYGRWGGWINPKKLKTVGRRMIRRVLKMSIKNET